MAKGFLEDGRGKPIFRYAVLSDTHVRPEESESSSPWKVNLYTNDRARWVVDRINQADPDFVVHLGDIVHPLPYLPTYGSAAESALGILGGLEVPCHCIPGNHDVGDKNNPTVPAYVVDDHGLDLYKKWFGPLYRPFDHGGVHFVLINAQALNSGLAHEDEHSKWLEADLEENKGGRIHLFSHYPPYILEPSEPSNYDNLDEPARSWLLKLLERYGVEALFAGHAHQFFFQRYDATDIYNVFSTSFVRQDYSEMFRVEAAEEYGRNDAEKLGWCIVDVYEDIHVARIFRSHGRTLRKAGKVHPEDPKVNAYHTKDGLASFLGVHLRHPWAEVVELPYNGPVDEFVRKRVRNDYTLLGLWECGIRKLRVPLSDLVDRTMQDHIRAMTEIGHRFTFFSVGVPSGYELEVLKTYRNIVDAVEIIIPWRDASDAIDDLLGFKDVASVPMFLANIESSVDRKQEGPKFSHYVGHGFRIHDTGDIEEFLGQKRATAISNGFVFQVGANESPLDAIQAISDYAKKWGFRAFANVRLASEDPAEYMDNNLRVANRVAESVVAAAATELDVFLDTFMDLDRGYFPRVGLYDRRLNPRMGSHVLAHLQGVLNDHGPEVTLGDRWETAGWDGFAFETSRAVFNMFLPSSDDSQEPRMTPSLRTAVDEKRTARIVNLVSGMISEVTLGNGERELTIEDKGALGVPLLCFYEK
ncbi:MAG: metallophosphoesterase [Candidatus Bathyarchaeota archaeon]|nr:metallophosphoesterase [Candidatus Bathyarchaeota archaeon]